MQSFDGTYPIFPIEIGLFPPLLGLGFIHSLLSLGYSSLCILFAGLFLHSLFSIVILPTEIYVDYLINKFSIAPSKNNFSIDHVIINKGIIQTSDNWKFRSRFAKKKKKGK
jgi:hypothetical protein